MSTRSKENLSARTDEQGELARKICQGKIARVYAVLPVMADAIRSYLLVNASLMTTVAHTALLLLQGMGGGGL